MAARELLFRVAPAIGALRSYTAQQGRADLIAGVTVAAVAVPQAMAYALLAGVPPQHGLYAAIVLTAVGAIFSPSRQLVNGPTNAISIAVLSAIVAVPIDDRMGTVIALTLLVGLVQIAITLLRLGDLTRYISHSVIVGFTLGAATLLVLAQVKNLLGLPMVGGVDDHFLVKFWHTVTGNVPHGPTVAVGVATIALIVALRQLKRRLSLPLLPDLLLVVVVMAVAAARLDLAAHGVRLIGEIPPALPGIQIPALTIDQISELMPSAFAIATLGLLEAIAMAKALASKTHERIDANALCLSNGLANVAGSLFQCIPGSGSLTRSAINDAAGAASQWSSVVSAVAVAAIVLLFAPYAWYIPRAALAGILMVSAWGVVDWRGLAYHVRATRFDATIVFATAFAAVAISVEFCILIGVLASFLLTVPRAGQMLLTEFVVSPDGVIHERHDEPACEKIGIFGFEGELFFGAAAALERHFETIEARVEAGMKVVVLRLKRVRSPDAVALHALDRFLHRLSDRGVHVLMCGVRPDLYEGLESTGIARRTDLAEIFVEEPIRKTSTVHAVRHAYGLLETHCAECPRTNARERGRLYFLI